MSTRSADVGTHAAAKGRGNAAVGERFQKPLRLLLARGNERALLDLVQTYEIDVTGSAAQELGKRNGMRLIRVLARDQTVFKDIPPARLIKIVRAGIQNVRDLVGIGNGHRAGALFVRDGVQRNGQIERDAFLGELHHFGDDAARRKTDIARADADALRIRHAAQKAHDVLVIVKGFAAAH